MYLERAILQEPLTVLGFSEVRLKEFFSVILEDSNNAELKNYEEHINQLPQEVFPLTYQVFSTADIPDSSKNFAN